IIFDVERPGNNSITLYLHATKEELSELNLRLLSPELISGSITWNSLNEVSIELDATPTSVVHVMFSDENSNYYGTQSFQPEDFKSLEE
ncbi:MAG: hypothetical protein ACK5L5_07995, partial [Bacteroidales bacterium]